MKNYTRDCKTLFKSALILLLFSSFILLSGCKKDDDVPVRNTNIKVVNAILGSTGLDVYIDESRKQENVGFATSTPYYELNEGRHKIEGTPAGTLTKTFTVNQSFSGNTNYSIYPIRANETLVVVDTSAAPSTNEVWVRYLNLSPADKNASYLVKENASTANFDFAARPYKQPSTYKAFPPGSYTFSAFDVTGNTNASVSTDPVTLTGGKIYTLFLMGTATENTLTFRAIED